MQHTSNSFEICHKVLDRTLWLAKLCICTGFIKLANITKAINNKCLPFIEHIRVSMTNTIKRAICNIILFHSTSRFFGHFIWVSAWVDCREPEFTLTEIFRRYRLVALDFIAVLTSWDLNNENNLQRVLAPFYKFEYTKTL